MPSLKDFFLEGTGNGTMPHLILFKLLLLIARAHGKYTTQKLLDRIHMAKWHQTTMVIIYTTCTINENSLRAFKVWFISSQQDIWKRWGESCFWFLKGWGLDVGRGEWEDQCYESSQSEFI